MTFLDFTWGSSIRRVITSVTITATMITACAAAWPTVEYFSPAHRGFVRLYADDRTTTEAAKLKLSQAEVRHTLRSIQIEQAEGKHEATNNDLAKWQLELGKVQDVQSKDLISGQIRVLEATKQRLESQIDTLKKPEQ